VLDYIFILSDNNISIGDHITGFLGLFVPIGITSIIAGFLFPVIMKANITALFLVIFFIVIGFKIRVNKLIGTLIILTILFGVTFVADIIKKDITNKTSWDVFITGKNDISSLR
jgi:hypothetical protein